jgi:hypothetical protein
MDSSQRDYPTSRATPLNHGHGALSLTGEGQPAYGSHIERLEIENSGP